MIVLNLQEPKTQRESIPTVTQFSQLHRCPGGRLGTKQNQGESQWYREARLAQVESGAGELGESRPRPCAFQGQIRGHQSTSLKATCSWRKSQKLVTADLIREPASTTRPRSSIPDKNPLPLGKGRQKTFSHLIHQPPAGPGNVHVYRILAFRGITGSS